MSKPKPTFKTVVITRELITSLTTSIKQHLLDNGGNPSIINPEVVKSALQNYNNTLGTKS